MSDLTPDAFLMGSGVKPASFKAYGDSAAGKITDKPWLQQQSDFQTKQPATWADGSPRMQMLVPIATDEREPGNAADDGTRCLYVQGQMQKVMSSAVRNGGGSGLEVGDWLSVTFTHHEGPAKQYAVEYRKGPGVAAGFLAAEETTPTPQPSLGLPVAATSAHAPASDTPQPGAGGADPAHLALARQLIGAGLPDATVLASAPSLTQEVLAALRSAS